jgi:membrane-bound ClpP family serine protease
MRKVVIMKEPKAIFIPILMYLLVFADVCLSDTFINRQTKEQLHGYVMSKVEGGQESVYTQEKGALNLNPGEWEVSRDKLGRNNKVMVVPVDDIIMFEIETAAFEQAIEAASEEGPLLILVEIDTPGGRTDLAHRMCAAITQTANCGVIAFIKGGQYGGAISAGAAVALACNKIYMANSTVIGAATLVTLSKVKAEGQGKEKSYKEVIDEKYSSVWRAYLASLAQQNKRPGLLARAMVDSDIEVIEVNQAAKRLFIEPVNKKPEQQIVRTWNKTGSLLTLTAEEAVECTIADGLVGSREQLLQQLQASDANVVIDKKMANARRELQIAQRKVDEIRKSFDMKLKQLEYSQPIQKALGILRGAKSDLEDMAGLAKKYPDLHIDAGDVENMLNSVNAAYENAIQETKRRR